MREPAAAEDGVVVDRFMRNALVTKSGTDFGTHQEGLVFCRESLGDVHEIIKLMPNRGTSPKTT